LRLLLDTHVVIWWFAGSPRLGKAAREIIMAPDTELFFSAASWWELSIKKAIGRLNVDLAAARTTLLKNAITMIVVSFDHADHVATLPRLHGDPFDRMLVAQASVENLKLLTRDRQLEQYGPVIWCV
jgi:PIN domain nuclease of toxin-antitoxin system